MKADVRNATAASARVISRRKMATAFSERMDETKYRNVIVRIYKVEKRLEKETLNLA